MYSSKQLITLGLRDISFLGGVGNHFFGSIRNRVLEMTTLLLLRRLQILLIWSEAAR
jgi:hypothetical protein